MKKVVLAGNAITAQIIFEYLHKDARYDVVGLVVDDEYLEGGGIAGIPSIGLSLLKRSFQPGSVGVVMASGYSNLNRNRESLYVRLKEMGFAIETYVHPDACVYTSNPLGEGSIVLPGAVVEPLVTIGKNSVVWCNVTLAHHCEIGDHCWLASGSVVSGKARIGRNTFIGVNATIVNDVVVSEYNIIGAGSLISKCTKPRAVYLARSGEELRYTAEDYTKHFKV